MPAQQAFLSWQSNWVIWLVVAIIMLYFARTPAHRAIRAFTHVIQNGMRLAARAVLLTMKRLDERNRSVLLSSGKETTERLIEREFHRVHAVVSRDLSGYPSLQRALNDEITKIDEDYRQSTEVPPSPPSWLEAIEAVAKIPSSDNSMVGKILEDINRTLVQSHNKTMQEYRDASRKRHNLLKRMMPHWRKLSDTLVKVDKTINGLQDRSKAIDEQMQHYEEMMARTDKAERMLSSSSLTQFFIAGLVLFIATMGGVVNFQLIALPMSEMVGGNLYVGGLKMSDIAALVIIMLEIACGLFLMESLRITRMFPVINTLDDRLRHKLMIFSLIFLTFLALVESSLAYMRDLLASDKEALTQALAGIQTSKPEFRWIPSVGQMVLGFILPFVLTFVAIPLESFIHASRTVIGVLGVGFLRSLAFVLRMIGLLFHHAGSFLIRVYDIIIFIPISIENVITSKRAGAEAGKRAKKSGGAQSQSV